MSWEWEQVVGPFERPGDAPSVTEGPVWDGEAVLFTDIPNYRIMRYEPAGGDCTVYRTETNLANGLKFGPDGRLYACEQATHRVVRYEPDGDVTVIADAYEGKELNAPNDLAFDGEGRLWFSDPYYGDNVEARELDHRSVYRAEPGSDGEWELVRTTYDTTQPNGLVVSPDGERLYVAQLEGGEGGDRELRSYPIREDGSLGEYEVLYDFYPGAGIDGMCLDEDGNIVAPAGSAEEESGPQVYVFSPSGRVLSTHPYPGTRATNCAFGGPDLRTLYVTGFDSGLHRARTDRVGYLGPP